MMHIVSEDDAATPYLQSKSYECYRWKIMKDEDTQLIRSEAAVWTYDADRKDRWGERICEERSFKENVRDSEYNAPKKKKETDDMNRDEQSGQGRETDALSSCLNSPKLSSSRQTNKDYDDPTASAS